MSGKAGKINVFVVDDEIDTVLQRLNNSNDFNFKGTNKFDISDIIPQVIHEFSILLLDIRDKQDEKAGIKLFRKLDDNAQWKALQGSVQIVFFSNEATAKNEYEATTIEEDNGDKNKKIKLSVRYDLAGFLAKKELLNSAENAVNVLRHAHERALRYKKYPSLADPLLRQCELAASPNNEQMQALRETILLAGRCSEPVLIQGETGTGKELVARSIQKISSHTERIGCEGLISYNIGSAPTEGNLQYTELFGAMKGSYTGCDQDRKGIFENATDMGMEKRGATIFLDEIGDAQPIIQTALLRVVQEKRIIRMGAFDGDKKIERVVEFRLITGSHRNLHEESLKGTFREDLYYRLSTIRIEIPPLRERKEDIPVLIYHFLEKLNREYFPDEPDKHKYFKDESIVNELKQYDWPGNVRQLESTVRALHVMTLSSEITLTDEMRDRLSKEAIIGTNIRSQTDNIEFLMAYLAERVYGDLKQTPKTFSEIAKKFGVDVALKIGDIYVREHGKLPDGTDSKRLFGSKPDAVRKWLNQNASAKRGRK